MSLRARAALAGVLLAFAAPATATTTTIKAGGYVGYKSDGKTYWMELALDRHTLRPVGGFVPLTLECATGNKTVHGAHVYTAASQSVHPHSFTVDSDLTNSRGTREVRWTYSHRQGGNNPEFMRLTGTTTRTSSGTVTVQGIAYINYAIGTYTTCRQTRDYLLRHVTA